MSFSSTIGVLQQANSHIQKNILVQRKHFMQ